MKYDYAARQLDRQPRLSLRARCVKLMPMPAPNIAKRGGSAASFIRTKI